MNKVKVIIFDLMGTLTTNPRFFDYLASLIEQTPIKIRKLYRKYKVARIDRNTFWMNLKVENADEIESILFERLVLRDNAYHVLEKLNKKFPLGLLSNFPKDWGESLTTKFKLKDYFEQIVFSGHHGVKKPSPDIYKIILSRFPNVNPKEILYIDDELDDLEGGKKLGFKTVWLKVGSANCDYTPDFMIKSLDEVGQVLKG